MDGFGRGRQRRLDHVAPDMTISSSVTRAPAAAKISRASGSSTRMPSSSSMRSAVSCMFAASSSEKTDMTGNGLRNWR
jgi:hypothetical protein